MDLAYDHIQEDSYPRDSEGASASKQRENQSNLNSDLQEAYRAFSSTPWGSRIGGFFGNVVKQGESVYREAQQELSLVGQDASRGFADLTNSLISRTRSLSLNSSAATAPTAIGSAGNRDASGKDRTDVISTGVKKEEGETAKEDDEKATVLSRLREEAAKRLHDLQQAEDAADEALLRFGSNLRDFLRDAIKIAPPTAGSGSGSGSGSDGHDSGSGTTILFESKDAQGKRVIHTSRFDAQLHVIHTTADSFTKDPTGPEYEGWCKEFDVDKKTEDIGADLAKYPDLRSTMEKLVPDKISYADFWRRYYYLRRGIETAEARRRDLLKAASAEEEVGWDEDESDESDDGAAETTSKPQVDRPHSTESSTTIHPPRADKLLKPSEPRKSNDEKSQADSDASYDVVGAASGVPSQAPSSPKESRKGDDSDEEDWE